MKKNQGLIYIKFNRDVDFFTLIGGVSIFSLRHSKKALETMDYSIDHRILIEGSGVEITDLSVNLVVNPKLPAEMYQKLMDRLKQGCLNTIRIEIPLGKGISRTDGEFILNTIEVNAPNEALETFDISFSSSGVVTQSLI